MFLVKRPGLGRACIPAMQDRVRFRASFIVRCSINCAVQHRVRLNSFSLQKKFSIKCRHLYISRSMSSGVVRRGCWAMTTLAPRSFRSATMSLLSKAVSPISAPNVTPSISGGTPTVSKRCPGKSTKRTRLPSASVSARILVVRPPLERPIAWLCVPLLHPVRAGGP